MIPKLKLLFLSGPNSGEKYLLEPSLDEHGKFEFTIGPLECDIELNEDKIKIVISFF